MHVRIIAIASLSLAFVGQTQAEALYVCSKYNRATYSFLGDFSDDRFVTAMDLSDPSTLIPGANYMGSTYELAYNMSVHAPALTDAEAYEWHVALLTNIWQGTNNLFNREVNVRQETEIGAFDSFPVSLSQSFNAGAAFRVTQYIGIGGARSA